MTLNERLNEILKNASPDDIRIVALPKGRTVAEVEVLLPLARTTLNSKTPSFVNGIDFSVVFGIREDFSDKDYTTLFFEKCKCMKCEFDIEAF